MSILITGLEMPVFEHQSWDIRKGADGKWYMVDTNAETSDGEWHEIIPVPPHGRVIEESKVLDIVSAWCPDDDGSVSKVGDLREMLDEIEALPTIIPPSEEAET